MTASQNPFDRVGGSFLPLAKIDAVHGRLICSAPSGGGKRQWTEVQRGTRLIPNDGAITAGIISFNPSLRKHTVPYNMPMPDVPNDGRTWQSLIEVPVLIEGLGLFMLSITGGLNENSINQNVIVGLRRRFEMAPQAQRGLLCEYILHGFEPVDTQFGVFQRIVLQLSGVWLEYDEGLLGVRLIPPPSPFISGPRAAPVLPHNDNDNDNGGTVVTLPINGRVPTPVATPEPSPPPAAAPPPPPSANDDPPPPPPSAAPPPPPSANDDPLARYRPAAGKKPY